MELELLSPSLEASLLRDKKILGPSILESILFEFLKLKNLDGVVLEVFWTQNYQFFHYSLSIHYLVQSHFFQSLTVKLCQLMMTFY